MVMLRLPRCFASGHTRKIPIPIGSPPIIASSAWVEPSL
ncbi:Uncharacterised protein [Mycobacteroides abscessus subsp. abscessus]|nr:Uncharacterised protein [Mycobacteroides abscessus subsp. abscessus]